MEHFTLAPLLPVENSFTDGSATVTNLQTSQEQQQQQQQQQQLMYGNSQPASTTTMNLKSEYTAFANCIQQSALLDQRVGSIDPVNMDSVSLGSFCDDLKYTDHLQETNNNNCTTITSQCTINEQQQQQQHNQNHVIITNVRNLTSHNFKQHNNNNNNNKTILTTTTTIPSTSAPNCNSTSDLNAEEVSAAATFNNCSLFFGHNNDNDLQQHHHQHHIVTPKAVLESVQTHLPQYFNLNKMHNSSESADIVYQQLPNDIIETTTTTSNANHHYIVNNNNDDTTSMLNSQTSQQQQQRQQQNLTILTNNSSNENNNNSINITASIPIYTTEANLVQKSYTNTQQQQIHNNNQTQQHQQETYQNLNNQHNHKRTNNKKLNAKIIMTTTKTTTTTTTTPTTITTTSQPTKLRITKTNSKTKYIEKQQPQLQPQTNCINMNEDNHEELRIDTTITSITISSTTIPTPKESTKTLATSPSVQSAATLYNTNNKFLNTCTIKHKERKCNNTNNNNNNIYQEESSNSDESGTFYSSDELIEMERTNFQGKKNIFHFFFHLFQFQFIHKYIIQKFDTGWQYSVNKGMTNLYEKYTYIKTSLRGNLNSKVKFSWSKQRNICKNITFVKKTLLIMKELKIYIYEKLKKKITNLWPEEH